MSFKESLNKLHEEYKDSPEDWEKIKKFAESVYLKRTEKYVDKVNKKYPASLIKKANEYVEENYSKAKASKMDLEERILKYMEDNPRELTTKELELVLGREGKKKAPIHNELDDEIGDPHWNPDTDEIEEKPKRATSESIRHFSQKELWRMPLKDLEKIIQAVKEQGGDGGVYATQKGKPKKAAKDFRKMSADELEGIIENAGGLPEFP